MRKIGAPSFSCNNGPSSKQECYMPQPKITPLLHSTHEPRGQLVSNDKKMAPQSHIGFIEALTPRQSNVGAAVEND